MHKLEMMSELTPEALKRHLGHEIVIVSYGQHGNPSDYSLECEDCNEVLADCEVTEAHRNSAITK